MNFNSKIVSLISRLTPTELSEVEGFLSLFPKQVKSNRNEENVRSSLLDLFLKINKIMRTKSEWTESDLLATMPRNWRLSKSYLKVRSNALYEKICDYLSFKYLYKEKATRDLCLLRELKDRGWNDLLKLEQTKVNRRFDKIVSQTPLHHTARSDLAMMLLESKILDSESALNIALNSIDIDYCIRKLDLLNQGLAIQRRSGKKHNFHSEREFVIDIIKDIKSRQKRLDPLLKIYFLVYQLFTLEDAAHDDLFEELYSMLIDGRSHLSRIRKWEIQDLFGHAINFCISRFVGGIQGYGPRVVTLYLSALEQGILFNNGRLSPNHYRNIILCFLRVAEFQAAEKFAEAYRDMLNVNDEYGYYYLNQATIKLRQGSLNEANEFVSQAILSIPAVDDFEFEAHALRIKIKVKFLIGEYEDVLFFAEKFSRTRRIRKMPVTKRRGYDYFLKIIKLVVKSNFEPRAEKKKALLNKAESILNTNTVIDGKWLSENIRKNFSK